MPEQGIPVQQVLEMRQQGLSDNQVIQSLQGKGFGSQQIFDAMSQADVGALPSDAHGTPIPGAPPGAFPPQTPPPAPGQNQGMPPQPAMQPEAQPPAQYAQPEYQQGYDQYYAQPQPDMEERIEEVAEAIINEKWEELAKEVNKITEWKAKMETQVQKVSDSLENLKEDMNQLRQGVLGKINEYDENMRNVGADLQAVQKVFKEVIPEFTKNVADLGRITKKSAISKK